MAQVVLDWPDFIKVKGTTLPRRTSCVSSLHDRRHVKTKKSLVWCKVPKAGSTTLTKMFLRLAGAKDISNTTRIHKLLRNYYPRLSSKVMTHRIRDSKTFVVVRDPFERILSAYRDKLESYERDLEYRDGYYYDHYGRFMVKDEKTGMTGNFTTTRKEPTWPEFVQYLLKTSVARYDEHWMPITRLCSPCKVDYNIVIKMENFAREIRQPLNYAKIDVASLGWAHKTGTSTNRKIINGYFKNLTLTDVKKLYAKYKKDFQLFGYTPFKYFKLFNNNNEQNKTVTE
ncbi:carbohydrate sulfotransferase 8 isoform X2 [Folsomia candida]|uniref:carbohydrate sulfotransferase 8 isoform X2 n=1 Tax=Folsomia candida TaxID=158441 RepID=UPI000B909AD9|nr:carbohydrate sulfotransferase 8 isoform X2 [Folsomia candida]